MCRSSPSPLDMLETTFRLLATGPHPPTVDGAAVGLPAGPIGFRDLRAVLFRPGVSVGVQRAVLVQLVRRARRHRAGHGWLAWLACCCRACRGCPPATHWIAQAPPPTSTPRCSPACSSSWTRQGHPARRSPSDCCGPCCNLPLTPPAPPAPGVAWLSVRGLPGEPIPDGRRGGRDTSGLGELGLQTQGTTRRRAARRPALALPRTGAPWTPGPAVRAGHAATG